ncbi:MAG: hypothetical protein ABI432_11050 [Flavobacteriales bacterium]
MKRALKYALLIVPGAMAIYIIVPIGDHCSGLARSLGWLLCVMVYLICLAFTGSGSKSGSRSDPVPLLITCAFVGLNYFIFSAEYGEKPWSRKVMTGWIGPEDAKRAGLALYTDGTFTAHIGYVDHGCTYTGDYTLANDTLKLLRQDISQMTHGMFAPAYRLFLPGSLLQPIDMKYEPVQITMDKILRK